MAAAHSSTDPAAARFAWYALHRGRDTLETPAQSTLYEVRCYHCRCSFAPGTRKCLHCGGKLGPPTELPFGRTPLDAPAGASDEGEEIPVPSFARAVLWVISAGVAIALSALQTCNR